jgi:hypothetical protein
MQRQESLEARVQMVCPIRAGGGALGWEVGLEAQGSQAPLVEMEKFKAVSTPQVEAGVRGTEVSQEDNRTHRYLCQDCVHSDSPCQLPQHLWVPRVRPLQARFITGRCAPRRYIIQDYEL